MDTFGPSENMAERSPDTEFLELVIATIQDNMHDEQFGVTELADKMNMSRSNLLLKIKKAGDTSVNQLIKETRLKRSMELLKTTSLNVSEVSHKVGFNSASYFIKCFREHYGYPPGEAGKEVNIEAPAVPGKTGNRKTFLIAGIISIAAVIIVSVVALYPTRSKDVGEKSVLVLPFKNDSNDSTNVYLINGLMESTLNNLQKIEDLRVLSRTSAEKYRDTKKSIPEIANELNVYYFVEGSGQKIGDQILLNIQLIEGPTDKHLWAKQYRREAKDIFELQQEIAKNIAQEIKAFITPEERERIEQRPTENLVAYDLYLKGVHEWTSGEREANARAIPFFKKAVEEDPNFAIAYAGMAACYYYLDIFQLDKKYTTEIGEYSDKALLLDPKNSICLVAKAMYYMHINQPALTIPYLEKAVEYNPNSGQALNFLSDVYNFHFPNTAKHLEYALKAVRLDLGSDSSQMGFNNMHLSAAFLQAGFLKEAQDHLDKSRAYDPNSAYVDWVQAGIYMAVDPNNFEPAKKIMLEGYRKDTTRIQLLQEIAKLEFAQDSIERAYYYFKKFNYLRKLFGIDIFRNADLNIGLVYEKMGYKEEAQTYFESFKDFADTDKTIYKDMYLSMYEAYKGNKGSSIEHLRSFSKNDYFQIWVMFLESEDLVEYFRDEPDFKKIMGDIKARFWANHETIKANLEKEGLI
ncbi:MAG TPA: helix-turn-helix domain-containing protein [Cyclobacteriaceae bacterium]|nr:helix-turn-helix domain-containing protein [Cyclobacteriaceae bacterium]